MNVSITIKVFSPQSHHEHVNEESVIDLFKNSHLFFPPFFSIDKISIHN